jgi:hypothetical protein
MLQRFRNPRGEGMPMLPSGDGVPAYVYGLATQMWNVDGITFWGVAVP